MRLLAILPLLSLAAAQQVKEGASTLATCIVDPNRAMQTCFPWPQPTNKPTNSAILANIASPENTASSLNTAGPANRASEKHKNKRTESLKGDIGVTRLCKGESHGFAGFPCGFYPALNTCVNVPADMNDAANSVNPTLDTSCTYFVHANCEGRNIHTDQPIDGLKPYDMHDKISSFICYDNRYHDHDQVDPQLAAGRPQKRYWGGNLPKRVKGDIGSVDLCLGKNFKDCKLLDAKDKCKNLDGDDVKFFKSSNSLRLTDNTECNFYDEANCTGAQLYSFIKIDWNNLGRYGDFHKIKWGNNIASFLCWDSRKKSRRAFGELDERSGEHHDVDSLEGNASAPI